MEINYKDVEICSSPKVFSSFFFVTTEVEYIVLIALFDLRLNCKRMESNTASLKRKKHKQRQDDLNDIISNMHILSNQFWVEIVLPYHCNLLVFTYSAARGLGPSAKKEVAAENCREIFQESRGKSSRF